MKFPPLARPPAGLLAVAIAAALAAGCSDDAPADALILEITSDAPLDGATLETLRVGFAEGATRVPATLGDEAFDVSLGEADPTRRPVRIEVRYGGVLVSRDPVALDRRGRVIIEARRQELGLVPLAQRTKPNPSPTKHIENAAALGVSPG